MEGTMSTAAHGSGGATRIDPVDADSFTAFMEQLQEGYVTSVAATAGCAVEFMRRDIYTLDALIIRSLDRDRQEVSLMAQLKCTTTKGEQDPARPSFGYQFKRRKDFERLAMPRKDPKALLLVMVTCPVQADWTSATHSALTTRHCCYWVSLEGKTVRPGVQSPSVQVPTANMFDSGALSDIMDKLDRGEALG
jgi:hypothetical protein